jgi:hypothetical protein
MATVGLRNDGGGKWWRRGVLGRVISSKRQEQEGQNVLEFVDVVIFVRYGCILWIFGNFVPFCFRVWLSFLFLCLIFILTGGI